MAVWLRPKDGGHSLRCETLIQEGGFKKAGHQA